MNKWAKIKFKNCFFLRFNNIYLQYQLIYNTQHKQNVTSFRLVQYIPVDPV